MEVLLGKYIINLVKLFIKTIFIIIILKIFVYETIITTQIDQILKKKKNELLYIIIYNI